VAIEGGDHVDATEWWRWRRRRRRWRRWGRRGRVVLTILGQELPEEQSRPWQTDHGGQRDQDPEILTRVNDVEHGPEDETREGEERAAQETESGPTPAPLRHTRPPPMPFSLVDTDNEPARARRPSLTIYSPRSPRDIVPIFRRNGASFQAWSNSTGNPR